MHNVRIDDEGIAAAFDRSAAPEAAALVAQAVPPVPPAEAWQPVTRFIASIVSNKVCPAWDVSTEIQGQWADALGECLEQLMPGGLGNIEAWGPWGKLAFASGLWVMAGIDLGTMTLKPRYPVDLEAPDNEQQKAQEQRGGGFSTDA